MYGLLTTFATAGSNSTAPIPEPSNLREALSGVSSSTSLACWIVLLLPQLIEQWRLKSSEGLAIGFITIWFIGDLANLTGAIWGGLLPGVILLAVWFCLSDGLLILSYFYYHNRGPKSAHATSSDLETQPLLNEEHTAGVPQRRKSSQRRDSLASLVVPETSNIWTQYLLPIIFVLLAGVAGYVFSGNNTEKEPSTEPTTPMKAGPEFLGYLSAALYLGARIPQIYQNHQKRSVHGLSLLFFLFSMLGNLTYAGGILLYRNDSEYVMNYLPWLLGSLGTIFEDLTIIAQFYIYSYNDSADSHAIVD